MQKSLLDKLEHMAGRFDELAALLADPVVLGEQSRFRELSKEYAQLQPVVRLHAAWRAAEADRAAAADMQEDADPQLRALGQEEARAVTARLEALEQRIRQELVPKDPHDRSNIFLEIRAAAGGDEAALFAGDLFRMYGRYAEAQGWKVEMLSSSAGEKGGFKEVISRIIGEGAYSRLKYESGAHRVQRVPETEAQGRIHTSTCTVAVLPEIEAVDEIRINPAEIREDTFRSSGAGGQHVNKTDSAIRLTHLPTGLVVECQDERSQHKNRARARALLAAKLLDMERQKQQREQAAHRKSLVGTGDRSERIRTYNFPQGRLTDHRIGLTLYQLTDIIEGDLDPVIRPLMQEDQAEQLASLENANA
ncbi:MAG: peptide chain release factor 1 [Gammaproteobacteria bacterium]|nr:peptide chain release factor 1 [Gammaproteobacteria bacterium]